MFAVIESGGKQHTVSEGESLKVELLAAEEGSTIEFDKVLMISDGSESKIGNPYLCLLYTSPSPRDLSTSRMPSSA